MSNRITIKTLRLNADMLNRITNSPIHAYTDGIANIGNYHISQAYGGYSLHRMHNHGGAVIDVFNSGHVSARELYNLIWAYARGLETQKEVTT